MDLDGIKQHVTFLQETITKAKQTTQMLVSAGVDYSIARGQEPHPEAQVYVDKMNRLICMIERGDLVDKQEALREVYECAYYKTDGQHIEFRMRYAAATTVARSIFDATSGEIDQAYEDGEADRKEKDSA